MEAVNLKQKYLTKVIQFNGHKMTLYSLDGITWSSKKFELTEIQERRELQRIALAGKKDEVEVDATSESAKPSKDSDYDDLDNQPDLDIDVIEDPAFEKDDLDALPLQASGGLKKTKMLKPKAEIKKPKKLKALKSPILKVSKLPKKPKLAEIKAKKLVAKPKLKKDKTLKAKQTKPSKKLASKKPAEKKSLKKAAGKKAA